MKNNFFMNNMKSIRMGIEEKHHIVKEINFDKDINIEKSDKYILDEKNNYLEFLFREVETVRPESYINILGESKTIDDGIKIIPTLNNDLIKDKNKRGTFLIEKPLGESCVDLVYVNFQKSYNAYFYFCITNHIYHNIMRKIAKRKMAYDMEMLISSGSKQMNNIFGYDALTIYNLPSLDFNLTIPIRDNSTKFLINLKENYIEFQRRKHNVPYSSFIEKDKAYISLICMPYDSSMENENVFVKSIVYGCKDGFIYLNPFWMESNELKVFVICSGNPIIQRYSKKMDKWMNISNNSILDSSTEIYFRIKMATGDKLYHFLIAKNK